MFTKEMEIKPGDTVEKKGRAADYTTGRIGTVLELDKYGERARVRWHKCNRDGYIAITTWVVIESSRGLKKIEQLNQN